MTSLTQLFNDKFQIQASDRKFLLAVSGGRDSMAMAHLFLSENLNFAIAHVNFNLRSEESDADEAFVQNWAAQNQIKCFRQGFDTLPFAQDYKLSIQEAARLLRYRWFEEIRQQEGYDYVCTAHHADDNAETFLMHIHRKSGVHGLMGIPAQNGHVLRPLLDFTSEELAHYVQKHQIQYREDSSNAEDKYLRNRLRHHILPEINQFLPGFSKSLRQSQAYLAQTAQMAKDAAILVYQQVAIEENDLIQFRLEPLLQLPNATHYLYTWLEPFGFEAWNDIYALMYAESGKIVYSPTHALLKDRDSLYLQPRGNTNYKSYWIQKGEIQVDYPVKLMLQYHTVSSEPSNSSIFVDADALEFPLEIRRWREGDSFQPIGMQGKSKKISKYFKDLKLSLFQKEKIWLLLSGDKIVWVIGYRADERFKIQPNTTHLLRISVSL